MSKLSISLKTPEEIIMFFKNNLSHRIDFTKEAIESARESCTLSPERVWAVLYHLSTSAWVFKYMKNSKDLVKDMSSCKCSGSKGFSRGEGARTRKDAKLMRQYKSVYRGRELDIEPHWTFPRESQSIHFGFPEGTQLIVVAHCGEHLHNATTSKIS